MSADDEIWQKINHHLVDASIKYKEADLRRNIDKELKLVAPDDPFASRKRFHSKLDFHERRLQLRVDAFRACWLETNNDVLEPQLDAIVYKRHLAPFIKEEHRKLRETVPRMFVLVDDPTRESGLRSVWASDNEKFKLDVEKRLDAIERKWLHAADSAAPNKETEAITKLKAITEAQAKLLESAIKDRFDSVPRFAESIGCSADTVYGMMRGDRTRYSEDKLAMVRKKLKIPDTKWSAAGTE
jgi:hypothetical protein